MNSPYDPTTEDPVFAHNDLDYAIEDSSLIWKRICDAAVNRTKAVATLLRIYEECRIADQYAVTAYLGESSSESPIDFGVNLRKAAYNDRFNPDIVETMDSRLWLRWHELTGLHLLPEEKYSYGQLATSPPKPHLSISWAPFTVDAVRKAKLKEIFERSTCVLFQQVYCNVETILMGKAIEPLLELPRVPRKKRWGVNDWRVEWLEEFNRVVQVLDGKPPRSAVLTFGFTSPPKASQCVRNGTLEANLLCSGDLKLRIDNPAVVTEINRILAARSKPADN